uniref:Uncharacterized protein n=1 Tax=Rhizophora mucronata TaxID=61149 RepID=A0A2P2QIZ6_RHIMU
MYNLNQLTPPKGFLLLRVARTPNW